MQQPSLLLFDIGGVVIESATFYNLNTLLPESLDLPILKQRWLQSPSVRGFELGQLSAIDFANAFIDEWQLNLSNDAFLTAFNEWPRDFYPEARETLKLLRKRYQVACLSNSNPLHWHKYAGFSDDFDQTFFSHLMGAIKPDPEAFQIALEQCQVPATEIYYFDDSISNIETAQSLGMQAFLVNGFQEVLLILREQGILAA